MKGIELGIEQVTEGQLGIVLRQGTRQVDVIPLLDAGVGPIGDGNNPGRLAIGTQFAQQIEIVLTGIGVVGDK